MVKALAASVWREHPNLKMVRAVFGSLNLPSPAEFERGKRESYDFLYAYDFSRAEEPARAENPLKRMARWRERLRVFLFPTETDLWLGLLRIGLGLQVVLYALSLRADWNYLFAGPGESLIGRALPEALLSTESPLVPGLAGSLRWPHELVLPNRRRSPSFGGFCFSRAAAWCSEFSPAHQQFWPGSFIFVQLRAEDSSPMESTTS